MHPSLPNNFGRWGVVPVLILKQTQTEFDERRISQWKSLKEELISLSCPGYFSLVFHWPTENGKKGKGSIDLR